MREALNLAPFIDGSHLKRSDVKNCSACGRVDDHLPGGPDWVQWSNSFYANYTNSVDSERVTVVAWLCPLCNVKAREAGSGFHLWRALEKACRDRFGRW